MAVAGWGEARDMTCVRHPIAVEDQYADGDGWTDERMIRRGQVLDRVATRAARSLLAWSARHVAPSRRGWITAMRMELDHIDGGWARLAWAVGGLRLVWMAPQERSRSDHEAWPEPASIVAGAMLLGILAWIAFTTRVPDVERMPAEMVFGFLALYFYSVGFLSGR